MDFKILFFTFLISIVSCSSFKEQQFYPNDNNTSLQKNEPVLYNIKLRSLVHYPYCGGAYPSESQKNGYTSPSNFDHYFISRDSILNSSTVHDSIIKSDDGLFHMKINPGKYYLFQRDKSLSLEDFVFRYQGNSNINVDHSCFERWKNTPDYSFLVEQDTTFEVLHRARCFTGTNPCLRYNGPYPP